MAVSVNRFKNRVISTIRRERSRGLRAKDIDRKIALGVLLWAVGAVAEADGKFLAEEEKEIKKVLLSYLAISEEDYPIILTAIRQAAMEKIDFYKFAQEIGKILSYDSRLSLIEDLFRVACADRELADTELAVIKKVAALFKIANNDFSDAMTDVKREFGL